MSLHSPQSRGFWTRSVVFAFALASVAGTSLEAAAESGPFSGMSGHWSGGGTLRLESGSTERIHCRATYSVGAGGNQLTQSLRCASDSYKLDISASVTSSGGTLSGTWSESAHGEGGSISGHASGAVIRAQVHGGAFSAGVGIHTSGGGQSVTITPTAGTDVRSVTISLHKG
jgi:hypothetical protein